MRNILLTFFVFTLTTSISAAESRCTGGGEGGGVPLNLVPVTSESAAHYVPTKELLLDFILWEKSNQVLYLDSWAQLWSHSLMSGGDEKVTDLNVDQLSKVADPGNRFLADADFSRIYDLKEKKAKFPSYPMPQQAIFWNEGVLYTTPKPTAGKPNLSLIYAYDANKNTLHVCKVSTRGYPLSPSSQSKFPYLQTFLSQQKSNGSFYVTRYPIDVRGALDGGVCHIQHGHGYKDSFPGAIKKHYYYESLDANVFELDHPTKNILWDRGAEECIYYNVQAKQSAVLLGEVPMVATWGGNNGLELLYPRLQKKIEIPQLGKFLLTSDSFALSENGKRLFVSQRPEENAGDNKILLRIDLRETHQY